jgi:hypothetical protein
MSDASRAFRDYATRVSFNMSLSRNQVGHLAAVIMEIEADGSGVSFEGRTTRKHNTIIENGGRPALFVMGYGSLARMGLIEHDPRWTKANESKETGAFWKYSGPAYQLTPAGEHVVELLRIAGLLPKAAANEQRKHRHGKAA